MERIHWFLYNCLFLIIYILILPRYLLRMWRRGGYRRGFLQRLGVYDRCVRDKMAAPPQRIWIHAVSVGEIQVALKFMAELRGLQPGAAFVLTTTTSTAHALAEKNMDRKDILLYFPADFPCVVRSVLRKINPLALVLVENELWPNLVRQTAARGAPIMLLNGRLSNRSFRNLKIVRPLTANILSRFSLLCAQSENDAGKLIALGADPDHVRVTGSAKYDVAGAPLQAGDDFGKKLQAIGFGSDAILLVAGSTWPGEETIMLKIFAGLRSQYRQLRLVLVPRHAERRNQVMAEIEKSGLSFRRWHECRQSAVGANAGPPADVLLVDTTGELRAFYSVATVVFIGKSLTAAGGQNPIEAAVFSKPIIAGPHMENFAAVMTDFLAADAILQVNDATALENAVARLLADENTRALIGRRARAVVTDKAGALRASVNMFFTLQPDFPSPRDKAGVT